jgi:hypothetical protein
VNYRTQTQWEEYDFSVISGGAYSNHSALNGYIKISIERVNLHHNYLGIYKFGSLINDLWNNAFSLCKTLAVYLVK